MSSHKSQKNRPKHRAKAAHDQATESPLQKYLRAFLYTLAVGASLLLIGSLAISFLADPARLIPPLAYSLSILTALVGGRISGRIHKKAPLTVGLVNGGLLLLVMLIGSLCFHGMDGNMSLLTSILLHTAVPTASVAGALMANRTV